VQISKEEATASVSRSSSFLPLAARPRLRTRNLAAHFRFKRSALVRESMACST
jgi:hypothetical protein